jgi:hypothetical protein
VPRRTRVYLTVDVETSMGAAWRYPARRPLPVDKLIFCRQGEVSYGLPLIVEELNKYGFHATFFTEVFFSHCLGADQAQIVFDFLLSHSQDVQLHIHPVFRNYARALKERTAEAFRRYRNLSDALSDYDLETQWALISEGADLFQGFVGEPAVAFRAGGFRGDRNTLLALGRVGIRLDSSYNPAISDSFAQDRPVANITQKISGIIEMPLTNAMSGRNWFRGWKPMAISSVSFAELKAVLEQAHTAGLPNVVFILHSFSTVKPRDIFYSSLRPDRMVISRFQRLLRYLADNANRYKVCTMGDAARDAQNLSGSPEAPKLELGLLQSLIRKSGQALDRLYWT